MIASTPMDEPFHAAQVAAWRRMSPAEKIEIAMAMYWEARDLKADYLRRRHPDWTADEIEAAVREIFLLATT